MPLDSKMPKIHLQLETTGDTTVKMFTLYHEKSRSSSGDMSSIICLISPSIVVRRSGSL